MCYINKVLLLLLSKWVHTISIGTTLAWVCSNLRNLSTYFELWITLLVKECMFFMVRCDPCQQEDMQTYTWDTHTQTHTALSCWWRAVNVIRQSIEMNDQLQENRPTCLSRHSKASVFTKAGFVWVCHASLIISTEWAKAQCCIPEDTLIFWSKQMLDESKKQVLCPLVPVYCSY